MGLLTTTLNHATGFIPWDGGTNPMAALGSHQRVFTCMLMACCPMLLYAKAQLSHSDMAML